MTAKSNFYCARADKCKCGRPRAGLIPYVQITWCQKSKKQLDYGSTDKNTKRKYIIYYIYVQVSRVPRLTQSVAVCQVCFSSQPLDKVLGVVEGQPCRLPEGTSGVDSLSTTPTTCQGMPSNVPPEVLAVSNTSGEGSLEISVPASPTIHSAGKVVKNVRS